MRKTELIPVIHMVNTLQVFNNVKVCLDNDIKKIFLINHAVGTHDLLQCAYEIKKACPYLWVGVNFLGVKAVNVIQMSLKGIDGLWCDEALTVEDSQLRKFEGTLFTGLAFKYQRQPIGYKVACEEAVQVSDVATTSGVATGVPASMEKVNTLREYLGEHPMAIASGVSISNVENYKGIADYLLVASSITDYKEKIASAALKDLKDCLK